MKVVYDTCLYIDFLRASLHEDIFYSRAQVRYMSPIVMMELRAGVSSAGTIRNLDQLFKPYLSAQRMIEMGASDFMKAGWILSRWKGAADIRQLANDVLIAISATKIGATLLTSNRKDFMKIATFIPLKLHLI